MEDKRKCKRNGCRKEYLESENNAQACNFHPGKPIFHDLKKGWTCCEKIVYDWDEFQQIKTCATGFHNDTEAEKKNDQSDFYVSNTVSNAQKGIENFSEKPVVKNINDYNKEQEEKRKLEAQQKEQQPKSVFKTAKGLNKCTNKGCLKEYDPDDPAQQVCVYHPGDAVFHDLKKSWTCCQVAKYDWDEFQQIKPCAQGQHTAKLV